MAIVVAAVMLTRESETPLDRAQTLVSDPENFDTGEEAGDTLAFAGGHLLEESERCTDRRGETPYCLTFSSAAAWSNVAAVAALTCRAPGRFELQRIAVEFFTALDDLPTDAGEVLDPPVVPPCE